MNERNTRLPPHPCPISKTSITRRAPSTSAHDRKALRRRQRSATPSKVHRADKAPKIPQRRVHTTPAASSPSAPWARATPLPLHPARRRPSSATEPLDLPETEAKTGTNLPTTISSSKRWHIPQDDATPCIFSCRIWRTKALQYARARTVSRPWRKRYTPPRGSPGPLDFRGALAVSLSHSFGGIPRSGDGGPPGNDKE